MQIAAGRAVGPSGEALASARTRLGVKKMVEYSTTRFTYVYGRLGASGSHLDLDISKLLLKQ